MPPTMADTTSDATDWDMMMSTMRFFWFLGDYGRNLVRPLAEFCCARDVPQNYVAAVPAESRKESAPKLCGGSSSRRISKRIRPKRQ
jgi:hypothetical protein